MTCSVDKDHRHEPEAVNAPEIPFEIDLVHGRVSVAGQPLVLRSTELRILLLLAKTPNQVFSRTEILEGINLGDYAVGERAVDVQIVSLRKKLGPVAHLVETVRRQGYRLREP